ncbi:LysR family transcriptional regulator [Pigmentiphaga sp. GD03639]|jgi:DNA-binding transcriptional LysR family regulator|uniref:LysR family transcriptional regulator n=1 Tax=unclassified Pigmentiphaga TaxID=2626614 RepID=UPI000B41E0D8|nr:MULTISPECIES: LysR family transcriptional regulator [unclassified Pigmentiphaga]MDH2237571.1 LysR family transcriptional regulator [Pigmentiphaga sp. GD03639]OVZ58565.1 LysR family transcriptional regulator [Pigmentiphaga sp. NML030171]
MRLDLADLRLFLAIVDAGSITQGATRANLALASASERLRNIEADAGVRLLERRHRGVVATEAGEALAHHARLILRQRELMQGELLDFASGARGTIRIHANTAALTAFLPRKLAPWMAARPHLNVDIRERTSKEIVKAVSAGLVEAGITSDQVDAAGLQLHPVATDHLVLITARGHPLAQRRVVPFAEIVREPFVGLAPGSALQDHIDEHARRAGHALALRIRMNTFGGLCEMVSHGVGVAVIPDSIAQSHRRRHPYQRIALADAWAHRRLCLCLRDWAGLSAPVRDLLSHLAGDAGVPLLP